MKNFRTLFLLTITVATVSYWSLNAITQIQMQNSYRMYQLLDKETLDTADKAALQQSFAAFAKYEPAKAVALQSQVNAKLRTATTATPNRTPTAKPLTPPAAVSSTTITTMLQSAEQRASEDIIGSLEQIQKVEALIPSQPIAQRTGFWQQVQRSVSAIVSRFSSDTIVPSLDAIIEKVQWQGTTFVSQWQANKALTNDDAVTIERELKDYCNSGATSAVIIANLYATAPADFKVLQNKVKILGDSLEHAIRQWYDILHTNMTSELLENIQKDSTLKKQYSAVGATTIIPLLKSYEYLIEIALREEANLTGIQLVNQVLSIEFKNNFLIYTREIVDMLKKINPKETWSWKSIALTCAVGAGIVYGAYWCVKNPDAVKNVMYAAQNQFKNFTGYVSNFWPSSPPLSLPQNGGINFTPARAPESANITTPASKNWLEKVSQQLELTHTTGL